MHALDGGGVRERVEVGADGDGGDARVGRELGDGREAAVAEPLEDARPAGRRGD